MSTHLSRRLALAFAVVVVVGSSLPSSRLPDLGGGYADKLLHFLEYAVLGYLVTRGWGPGRPTSNSTLGGWFSVVALLVFAALDEFHQHWIPGRSVEFWDWTADAAGTITGFVLGVRANRRTGDLPGHP
jgi:VanZ family protein